MRRTFTETFKPACDDDEIEQMERSVEKMCGCIHVDGKGELVFSIGDFIRLNNLPDDPRLRLIILEEVREIFPGVQILEEIN